MPEHKVRSPYRTNASDDVPLLVALCRCARVVTAHSPDDIPLRVPVCKCGTVGLKVGGAFCGDIRHPTFTTATSPKVCREHENRHVLRIGRIDEIIDRVPV